MSLPFSPDRIPPSSSEASHTGTPKLVIWISASSRCGIVDPTSDEDRAAVSAAISVGGIDRTSIFAVAGDGGRLVGAALRIRAGGGACTVVFSTCASAGVDFPVFEGAHAFASITVVAAVNVL